MKYIKITLLIFCFSFLSLIQVHANSTDTFLSTSCNWTDEWIIDKDITDINTAATCACWMSIAWSKDAFTKEEDLINETYDGKVINCVANLENRLLIKKWIATIWWCEDWSSVSWTWSASGISSCKIKAYKALNWWEQRRYAENSSWLSCSNLDFSNEDKTDEPLNLKRTTKYALCITDMRAYQYYLLKTLWNDRSSALERGTNKFFQWVWNSLLSGLSYFTSISSFWIGYFDKLPQLPFQPEDRFKTNTIIGLINVFSLGFIGFISIWFLFTKWWDRQEDSYIAFFIKLGFILFITIWFSFFYNWLNNLLDLFRTALIESLWKIDNNSAIASWWKVNEILERWINMQFFDTSWVTAIDLQTLIFFIPNIILLFIISFVTLLRDFFIQILSYLFFLLSIWVLIGTIKKDDIFESQSLTWFWARFLVLWLNFALSLFISIVLMIVVFMFITIFFATIPWFPYYWENLPRAIENLWTFGIDAFIYLLLLSLTIWGWYKYLRPLTFGIISDIVKSIFFRHTQWFNSMNDLYSNMQQAYSDIHNWYQNMKDTDLYQSIIQPKIDGIWIQYDALKNNKLFSAAAQLIESPHLTDENSLLRKSLSTTIALWTWTGKVELGNITDKLLTPLYSDKIKAKRELLSITEQIQNKQEKMSLLDLEKPSDLKQFEKFNTELEELISKRKNLEEIADPKWEEYKQKEEELRYKEKLKKVEQDIIETQKELKAAQVMNNEWKSERLTSDLKALYKAKEWLKNYLSNKGEYSSFTDTDSLWIQAIEQNTQTGNISNNLEDVVDSPNMDFRKELWIPTLAEQQEKLMIEEKENQNRQNIQKEDIKNIELKTPDSLSNIAANIVSAWVDAVTKEDFEVQKREFKNNIQHGEENNVIIKSEDNNIFNKSDTSQENFDFLNKFEEYQKQNDLDNIKIFGDNPIVGKILEEHFRLEWDIIWIWDKIKKYRENIPEQHLDNGENSN